MILIQDVVFVWTGEINMPMFEETVKILWVLNVKRKHQNQSEKILLAKDVNI